MSVMEDREMRTIKVRNIFDSRIDEELLYELFLQAGPINSITMPVGPNGRKTMAIIEYTYEVAVPFALFIFEGTELYGVRLYLSSSNNNPPEFYVPKDGVKGPPIPPPFDNFAPPPNMMMNFSNSSIPSEPNFEALLEMGQNMLIPPPLGFGGSIPMSLPLPPYGFNTNDHGNQRRNDYRNEGRERNNDRGERHHDSPRRKDRGKKHKYKRR
ncbi:hypothetical protein M8J75_007194 [Diaphorina citri]|nr:hypothetical protein M8J75_007194 [Diaphorina citri]